jgi:hypothetical protein
MGGLSMAAWLFESQSPQSPLFRLNFARPYQRAVWLAVDAPEHVGGEECGQGRTAAMEGRVRRNLRVRFWAELGLASITGLLALITPIFPDWIELVSGWDPDQQDGSVERLIVVGLFIVAAAIFALAAAEWRRTPSSA